MIEIRFDVCYPGSIATAPVFYIASVRLLFRIDLDGVDERKRTKT